MNNKTQNTTDHNRQAKAELRRLSGKKPTPGLINSMIRPRKTNWAEYNKSWRTIEALTAGFMPKSPDLSANMSEPKKMS